MLKKVSRNADGAADEQREINRQLFEIIVILMGQLNELIPRVEALRALQQVGGSQPVPLQQFEEVVAQVKKQMGPEANETLGRVQRLVAALKLQKQ